jgi:hypothetical protein
MDEFESLSHTKWDCKYNMVFIPKYRRKTLYDQLRSHLGDVFRQLAAHNEHRILEGQNSFRRERCLFQVFGAVRAHFLSLVWFANWLLWTMMWTTAGCWRLLISLEA